MDFSRQDIIIVVGANTTGETIRTVTIVISGQKSNDPTINLAWKVRIETY